MESNLKAAGNGGVNSEVNLGWGSGEKVVPVSHEDLFL